MINQAHPEVSLFRPSISFLSSSELQEAIFPARRSVEIVRIWEIFAHVRLGKTVFRSSNVSGNEALGSTPSQRQRDHGSGTIIEDRPAND